MLDLVLSQLERPASFPLQVPPMPSRPMSSGSRSRQRYTKRVSHWKTLSSYIIALNALYRNKPHSGGRCRQSTTSSPAQQSILARASVKCQELCRARRALGLSGAQSALKLVKSSREEIYGIHNSSKISQVTFIASAIAEPSLGSPTVNMLEALPAEEAAFYSREENLLIGGTVPALLADLERQYGFFGGVHSEWVTYLNRTDIPQDLWVFYLEKDIKARAGVSAVPKKDPSQLRKLIMACPAN